MNTTVDANLFRLVYGAVSTEERRYYLNGVHIEPHENGGAILVSTDGHRAIVAHDPEGTCAGPIIVKLPRFALAQCKCPKMFKARRQIVIDHDAGTATINELTDGINKDAPPKVDGLLTAHHVLIDGTFPEWRRVVPQKASEPLASKPTFFNPKYLKEWGALGVEIEKSISGCSGGLMIELSDSMSPVILRWSGAQNIFGIQMPMRGEVRGFLPPFMATPKEQLQAAE